MLFAISVINPFLFDTMKQDLTKLENLTDAQLNTISTNVDKLSVRKAAAEATRELGRDIDKSTIQRFVARGSIKEFLDETPDTAAAATEILRYAATGIPSFTDATAQVLDQTAFKLSLVCTRTEEEMKALTQVNSMLYRHRTQSVRERMAAVQERKAKLREQELELRRSKNPDRHLNRNPHHPPQSDSLGDLALTGDDIERRTCTKFNLKHNQEMGSAGVSPADEGVSPESSPGKDAFHGVPNIEKPVAATRESAALQDDTASNISIAQIEETHQVEPASSQLPVSNNDLSPSLPLLPSVQTSIPHETPNSTSELEPRPSDLLPLYCQTEKNSERLTSPSLPSPPSVENAPKREAAHSASDLELRPSGLIISHAIRRWRSYHPRYYWDPEPTNSWTDECPCGSQIPCEKHPDLWGRVRYTKPSDPAYSAALKEHGIPMYIPTNDELTRPEPTDVPCNSPMWEKKPNPQQSTQQNYDKGRHPQKT